MSRLHSWLKNFNRLTPEAVRRLFWLGLALLFTGLFVKLTEDVSEHGTLDRIDQQILVFISKLRITALNGPAVDITALGSPTVITLFTVIGMILLWLKHDRRGCIYLVTGSIGAGVATFFIKLFFARQRPTLLPRLIEVSGFSYPSGHSLTATSFYLLLMFITWRHYQSWQARTVILVCAVVVIGSVCLSRLYLGVHYPSDVLSGVFLGAAWVCLLTAYFSHVGSRSN